MKELSDLKRRVVALEKRLAAVADAQTRAHDRFVTHQLVVVDDEGFERLTTQHSIDAFEVFVSSKNVDGAHVKLYAGEEGGESETLPTAALTVRGLRGAVELASPSEGDACVVFETTDDDDERSLSWHEIGSLEALQKFVIMAEQYAEAVEK